MRSYFQNSTIFNFISAFFSKGHERSIKAKKNIVASIVFKGLNIIIGLILVPITLNYLGSINYGVFITLISIVGWFSFFDLGLGHGLKNKIAEAIAVEDLQIVKTYISSAYFFLSIISFSVFFVFIIINSFLDWSKILNAPSTLSNDLSILALFIFATFCIRFVFQIIKMIIIAHQRPALADFIDLLGRLLILITVLVLFYTTKESILLLGIAYTAPPIFVLIISNIFLFANNYKYAIPSIKNINWQLTKGLLNLGSMFFIIQIASIVLFSTDNIIITQFFGPEFVTKYQITQKYFNVSIMVFTIILNPFWIAFTDAYYKKELFWIKNTIKRLISIWSYFIIIVVLMLFASDYLYKFWIGDLVDIPFKLSAGWALFVILFSLNNIFVKFINGVGKLRVQLYTAIFSIVFNIPISIFFAITLGLGTVGVILGTGVSILISIALKYIQYQKLINNTAYGIWDK